MVRKKVPVHEFARGLKAVCHYMEESRLAFEPLLSKIAILNKDRNQKSRLFAMLSKCYDLQPDQFPVIKNAVTKKRLGTIAFICP